MTAGPDLFLEPERKLAAILAADVVGFSRMMGADELGTLARLDTVRRRVIDPVIAAHRGRVFKEMGDGMLVEFGSVVQALRAAVAIQAELPAHAAADRPAHRIVLRIGVHQGDVLMQGSDLLGDGVNVAARLERMAPPGGICMSARVREDAAGKVALTVEDGGERTLRNIAQPVRVFFIRPPEPKPVATPLLAGAARTLVAVVPFASGGGEVASILAAQLPLALIAALSRWPGLLAAPAAPLAGSAGGAPSQDAVAAAQSVGAAYALQGAVRLEGPGLLAGLRVLDTGTGQPVWSGRHEILPDAVEAALRDLPGQVAAAIGTCLLPWSEPTMPGSTPTTAPVPQEAHWLMVIESAAHGPPQGHVAVLRLAPLVIGRQAPSDLVLPSGEVSRTHCRVELDGGAVTVTDLRSTNGTYLDGDRITGTRTMKSGSTLKVGPYVLRYLLDPGFADHDPEATLMAADLQNGKATG